MRERIVTRDGRRVVEVRSDAGRLLFVKTSEGYEFKCPRSKQVCLVPYARLYRDCLRCGRVPDLRGGSAGCTDPAGSESVGEGMLVKGGR